MGTYPDGIYLYETRDNVDKMKEVIKIGQAVLVPFGRQGLINAFIVGFSDYVPENIRVKKINKIL